MGTTMHPSNHTLPVKTLEASDAIRARADVSDDRHINEAIIIEDVLLTGPEPAVVWQYRSNPTLLAESVHYNGLLDRIKLSASSADNLDGQHQTLSGDYAILAGIWSTNFYHWFEELFRANMIERSGFEGKYIVPRGDHFIQESLEMLGISTDRVVVYDGSSIAVERAWFTAPAPMYSWAWRPNMFYQFRSNFLRSDIGESTRRVFILRGERARNPRDIVNRDDVVRLAREFDYETVDLALLPFKDQVRVAASCQSMMGMHGAGFCHSMFMRRNSSVIEFFSPNYINYTTLAIATLLRHKYSPIVSQKNVEYSHGDDALVDTRLLRIALENDEK